MLVPDVEAAKKALADRECLTGKKWLSHLGSWQRGEPAPAAMPELPAWATAHAVDAFVWTALGPKFGGEERTPTVDEVVKYLQGLTGTKRDNAERYIRYTPRQIDTHYRRRIEAALGWTYRKLDAFGA